jgi:hypothetical protein
VPIVAPEHRPTLREELAPLPPRARWAVLAVLGLLALALLVALTREASTDGTRTVVNADGFDFNLRYQDQFQRLRPPGPGELFKIERPGLDSFTVQPLNLPAYRGDVNGILPVVAARELDALKRRFPGMEPVEEGKTRINQVAGYTLAFRVSRRPRTYGRLTLLPEPVPGARRGVKLLMLATPKAGAGKARDVGTSGRLKTPYRSFRFGTESP